LRSRDKYSVYPAGLPLFPVLKEPQKLLAWEPTPEARLDARRLVSFFDVRYVVIHRRYLAADVLTKLDTFVSEYFPHTGRGTDGELVVYPMKLEPAPGTLWPDDYVINFGANRAFALLSGWSADARWGDVPMQWSSGRESSLYVYLGEPADRVLDLRV